MSQSDNKQVSAARLRMTAAWCAVLVVVMVGMSYAAVPIYQMICQVTGIGGTTRVAAKPSDTVLDRKMTVRFDANTSAGMPWAFEPLQRTVEVKIGENTLVFYRATNNSDAPVTGTATFNVLPEQSGPFFNKLECFCFKEQTLAPGESIDMPVSFFIDPAIVNDKDARGTTYITLSYTFYPVTPRPGLAEKRDDKAG